jgi:hypothetical protein
MHVNLSISSYKPCHICHCGIPLQYRHPIKKNDHTTPAYLRVIFELAHGKLLRFREMDKLMCASEAHIQNSPFETRDIEHTKMTNTVTDTSMQKESGSPLSLCSSGI